MAVQVVELLEAVEVDGDDGHLFALAIGARQFFVERIGEMLAVGQGGQVVVAGHAGDALFGDALLRQVVERRHPAAVGHGAVGDGDRSVGEQLGDDRAAARTGDDGAVVGVGLFQGFDRRRLAVTRGEDAGDDGAEAGARGQKGLVDAVEVGETFIGQDQLFVAIEQT